MIRWWMAILGLFALASSACTFESAGSADNLPLQNDPTESSDSVAADGPLDSAPCEQRPRRAVLTELPTATEAGLLRASAAVYPCADAVVLVGSRSNQQLAEASQVSIAVGAPLLLFDDGVLSDAVLAELRRLRPTRIRVYGSVDSTQFEFLPIVSVFDDEPTSTRTRFDRDLVETVASLDPPRNGEAVFVVGPGDERAALAALPAIVAAGASLIRVDPGSVDSLAPLTSIGPRSSVIVASEFSATEQWQIDLAIAGTELPGGGTEVFPDRRLVAFYGSPVTHRLGVLGEQDPRETLARLAPIVESYATPENPLVIPAYEVIATVATGSAGPDGDYSQELSVDVVEEWVDVAADNNAFVLIDLQPGRTDFLTQAKRYETLLRQPHVGLALDPEWRLGPDELPLRRIGSVDAAEVNAVAEWLAEIVREETLPQKLLILHQFLPRMLADRGTILTAPELAVVVHVDGQGSLASKFATYRNITGIEVDPGQQIWWGWKNFYDEDSPVASPERVNGADPLPMVVTYQ